MNHKIKRSVSEIIIEFSPEEFEILTDILESNRVYLLASPAHEYDGAQKQDMKVLRDKIFDVYQEVESLS